MKNDDLSFKALSDMDSFDNLKSGFDLDAKGRFLKGADGYQLGE